MSLAFVNAFSTIWAINVQKLFTFCKVGALIVVIVVGAVQLGKGKYLSANSRKYAFKQYFVADISAVYKSIDKPSCIGDISVIL